MKIYVGHSRSFDYTQELYIPLRKSILNSTVDIIFPHENGGQPFNSKEDLKKVDFMVAEVSHPSTGLGIEMGYSDIYKVPIIVAYKMGSKVSNSAKSLGTYVIEYSGVEELIQRLGSILKI